MGSKIAPTTAAPVNTEFSEDAAHSSGATGALILGVRRDADTSPVNADNDYHTLIFNNAGAAKVEVFDGGDSHTVDWAGTAPPIGAGTEAAALRVTLATDSTGLVSIDDSGGTLTVDAPVGTPIAVRISDGTSFIDGYDAPVDDAVFNYATSEIVMFGAVFGDTAPDSVDEDDGGALRMSANRNLFTTIRDAAGNERGANVDASNNLQVDIAASSATVTVTATNLDVQSGGADLATAAGQLAAGHDVTVDNASGASAVNIQDGGNIITVDGTITADLSATDNAVLDTIDAVLDTIKIDTEAIETAVELIDNVIFVDDADFTLTTSSVLAVGVFRDDVTVDASGTAGDIHVARSNDQGALWVEGAHIDSTDDCIRDDDLDETAVAISANAGVMYGCIATNLDATPVFVHFYNVAAASVTVGTTVGELTICIPSQGDANGAAGVFTFPKPLFFDTAASMAATTTVGGNTGPGANELFLNVWYRDI